jgi:hypothetical protein
MDGTPGLQSFIAQIDAGAVLFNPKGILSFDIALPYLTVRNLEVTGYPVYIGRIYIKGSPRQSVTTEAGAIGAE